MSKDEVGSQDDSIAKIFNFSLEMWFITFLILISFIRNHYFIRFSVFNPGKKSAKMGVIKKSYSNINPMIKTAAKLKNPLVGEVDSRVRSIFQTPLWRDFKLATGYSKSHSVNDVEILQKQLPFGLTMLYAPMVNETQLRLLKLSQFVEEITSIAKQQKALFFRFELDIDKSKNNYSKKLLANGFLKSFEEMQPVNNWLIDLKKSEQEILAEMKQKCRYNIRQGEKGKLKVTWTDKQGPELKAFYKEYSETGQRHQISYREKSYFDHLIDILGQKGYARVYIAWKEKTPLASAIVIYDQSEALYLYGGSSDKHRELMAPYFLQWQIIKDAKSMGKERYNFLGISPDNNPNHPWAGLTSFKKRFGGYQYDTLGCFDLPLNNSFYKIFMFLERLRRH